MQQRWGRASAACCCRCCRRRGCCCRPVQWQAAELKQGSAPPPQPRAGARIAAAALHCFHCCTNASAEHAALAPRSGCQRLTSSQTAAPCPRRCSSASAGGPAGQPQKQRGQTQHSNESRAPLPARHRHRHRCRWRCIAGRTDPPTLLSLLLPFPLPSADCTPGGGPPMPLGGGSRKRGLVGCRSCSGGGSRRRPGL